MAAPRAKSTTISINVDVNEVLDEVVNILHLAKTEIGFITNAVNEKVNTSMESTTNDVVHIIGNVKQITDNLAQTTGTLYQPVFVLILLFLIIFILLAVLLCIVLKARQEYKKRPIKLSQRLRRNKPKTKIEPQQSRRSTSVLSAEEGRAEPPYSEKKRNDTLV